MRSRRTNKSARRYLLVRLLRLRASVASTSSLRPRGGRHPPLRLREGGWLQRLRQDIHQRRTASSSFSSTRCLHRLDTRELAARDRAAASRAGRRALAAGGRHSASRSCEELSLAYGNGEITMVEWRTAREPIEQRLTAARKQLAQVSATRPSSTASSATRRRCETSLGHRSTSPASTPSLPLSSIMSSSAPPGAATTASTSPACVRSGGSEAASRAAPRPRLALADR